MRPFKVNVYASDFEEAELAAGRKPPSVLAAEAAAAAKAAKKNGTSSGSNTSGNAMPLSFGSSGSGVGGGGNNGMGPTDNASPGSKMTKVARGRKEVNKKTGEKEIDIAKSKYCMQYTCQTID